MPRVNFEVLIQRPWSDQGAH